MQPDAWAYPALLWWRAWSNSTFLHIPKTGGTLIEQLSATSGRERILMLPPAVQAFGSLLHHMTPEQLDMLNLPASYNPYREPSGQPSKWLSEQPSGQHRVFCIMREPIERFVSALLYQETMCRRFRQTAFAPHEWKTARAACLGEHCIFDGRFKLANASEITPTLVRCFARFAQQQQWRPPKPWRPEKQKMSEAQLHLQPQSAYIRDSAGRPTCHDVFRFEDVAAARIVKSNVRSDGRNFLSPRALATRASHLLRQDAVASSIVRTLYHEDFAIWSRVVAREAPTLLHAPLVAEAARLVTTAPLLARAPPSCSSTGSSQCTCPLCCGQPALRRNYRLCMQCMLDSKVCGGAGRRMAAPLPRAAALVCEGYWTRQWNWLAGKTQAYAVGCNTCGACCNKTADTGAKPRTFVGATRHRQAEAWLRLREPSCAACDARECLARS